MRRRGQPASRRRSTSLGSGRGSAGPPGSTSPWPQRPAPRATFPRESRSYAICSTSSASTADRPASTSSTTSCSNTSSAAQARHAIAWRRFTPLADRADLMTTLRSYLGNARNRRQTAADLHVHANTVDYRLRQVGRLTGLDPVQDDQLPRIVAALVAFDARRSPA
ncbi:helix-turn-helix domain-containing protein [Kribbella sp. NPDC000426]|uniref:helix-turn-helix domain-containing protein n=1 Tax=Kribbella sp. NPDC000426 TaxID=3154255 RepID=UPI00332F0373